MNEIDSLILAFVFGFTAGFLWFSYRLAKNIKQIAKEMNVNTSKIEIKTTNPIFFTELVNDVILLYDKSDQFITQGNSLDEVATNLYQNKIKSAYVIHMVSGEKIIYLINEGKIATEKI